MTIEEIIKYLPAPICCDTVIGKKKQKEYNAHDSAIIILRKYQKIQKIANDKTINGDLLRMSEIRWVLEDGNDD